MGEIFEDYARTVVEEGNTEIFSHFSKAIVKSKEYKSKKYNSLGLIQFMLIMVKVRLTYDTLPHALNGFIEVIQNSQKNDLVCHAEGLAHGWTTSTNNQKKLIQKYIQQMPDNASNLFEGFEYLEQFLEDPTFSGYQVTQEYLHGFPTIKRFVTGIDEKKGIMKSIEETYNARITENPTLNKPLLADFSACAIFLYLSYQDGEEYILK